MSQMIHHAKDMIAYQCKYIVMNITIAKFYKLEDTTIYGKIISIAKNYHSH